ncbi:MAG: putative MarR family transcriptional regulator [Chloroflexi bacterium]|jgi:DNA-binding MarR family transcriptional regulator|nr:putative MarR family transcriptional regulator [Chloroflexota bacterium]
MVSIIRPSNVPLPDGSALKASTDRTRAANIPRIIQLNALLWPETYDQPWLTWMDLDLTMPQFKLLLLIASCQGLRVGDLAQRLGVTPPTVTTILDRLVEHGLVRREDDPVDRRLVIARLTAEGMRLLQRLNVHAGTEIAECMDDLSPEDLRCLQVGMEALHRTWESRQTALANASDPEAC